MQGHIICKGGFAFLPVPSPKPRLRSLLMCRAGPKVVRGESKVQHQPDSDDTIAIHLCHTSCP